MSAEERSHPADGRSNSPGGRSNPQPVNPFAQEGVPAPLRWQLPAFELVRPRSLSEALAAQTPESAALSGGTDLLDRMKAGVAAPRRVIDLSGVDELRGILATGDELIVGAGATLAELAEHPGVRQHAPALAQAAHEVATPALRNMGTLGGNLAQRPRCWYFRNPWFPCFKKGGDACYAWRDGEDQPYRGKPACAAVHPSSIAAALVALDATVRLARPSGRRAVPASEFWLPQGEAVSQETVLQPDEWIIGIALPLSPGGRWFYAKIRDQESWDFVAVSGALAIDAGHSEHDSCRFVIAGLENRPWRGEALERAFVQARRDGASAEAAVAACRAAFEGAWGALRSQNPTKFRQAWALVGRLVRQAAEA